VSHTVKHLVRQMRARSDGGRGAGVSATAGATATRGAGLRTMRELNRGLVLNCIRTEGPLARVAIAERTRLSRTTVGSIVDALLKDGLVREGELLSAARSGGRKATPVHFHAAAGVVLGVDLGRTHLTIIAANLAAEPLARHSGPLDTDAGPDVCLPGVVDALRCFAAAHGIGWDTIVGAGLGIPGPMDGALRTLVAPPRMPGWDRVDVRAALRRALRVPVYLDNDANMGALGESRFGAGRGVADFAYVKVGTGIGCGLVVNGAVYRGSQGFAGELGHLTLDVDGPLCDCGNRGCLEAVAGAGAIVRAALGGAGRDGDMADVADVDVADVVRAALAGDAASREAIARAGEQIGVALAGLVNLVNPSLILLDGGVARAGELLIAPVRAAIAARSLAAASASARIEPAALGESAIALGAVALVLDAAFAPTVTALVPPLPGAAGTR
jgi:predicted NBD/HSP70 family sugar kinase